MLSHDGQQALETSLTDEQLAEAFAGGSLTAFVSHIASGELLGALLVEASRIGIAVNAFFMDEAVGLLADGAWVDALPEGRYAACDVSARNRDVAVPERIIAGGQYQNSIMVHGASRVVSL